MPQRLSPVSDRFPPQRARRDLLWCLEHDPLVTDAFDGDVHWLGLQKLQKHASEWKKSLAALSDANLDVALQERRSGRYFEALVAALVRGSNRWELLAHDQQVIETQPAGKHTLGAFDLVMRERQTGHCVHLELAFKQYLLRSGDARALVNWVGPRGRDRLDLKLEHMRGHQLGLGLTPAGQACLQDLGVQDYQRWACMAGRLFVPWNRFVAKDWPQLPRECPNTVEWGWWLRVDQQRELKQAHGVPYLLPPRWTVAPIQAGDCDHLEHLEWFRVEQLLERGIPSLVALTRDGVEWSRGWIVA